MRIFMTKRFAKYVEDEGIEIDSLVASVHDINAARNQGQWSDLGGGVYKVRVARGGKVSSRGYRVILLLRRGDKAFYVQGFSKKDQANISAKELRLHKTDAKIMLKYDEEKIRDQLIGKQLLEIKDV